MSMSQHSVSDNEPYTYVDFCDRELFLGLSDLSLHAVVMACGIEMF